MKNINNKDKHSTVNDAMLKMMQIQKEPNLTNVKVQRNLVLKGDIVEETVEIDFVNQGNENVSFYTYVFSKEIFNGHIAAFKAYD